MQYSKRREDNPELRALFASRAQRAKDKVWFGVAAGVVLAAAILAGKPESGVKSAEPSQDAASVIVAPPSSMPR